MKLHGNRHHQIPPFSYSLTGHGGSVLQQQVGVTRKGYIASAASSACRSLVIYYYDPIYTVSILQELIPGASTSSQPTIGLQKQVANTPIMLETSSCRNKNQVKLKYLRVLPSPWFFSSPLLRAIKLSQPCCEEFTCTSQINIRQWHLPVIPGIVVLLNLIRTFQNIRSTTSS